ncbi:hypothetical protein KI387_031725, partial [Taxus chinensis]
MAHAAACTIFQRRKWPCNCAVLAQRENFKKHASGENRPFSPLLIYLLEISLEYPVRRRKTQERARDTFTDKSKAMTFPTRLSCRATSDGHGENSPYFDGWKEYETNPYHPQNNPSGIIQMGLAENQ